MKQTAKRIAAYAGLAAGTAAAAALSAYVTTRYLVNTALDRDMPKAMQKADRLIAGSAVDNDFLKELDKAAARLLSRENETVQITSHDGETLVGHYIPCEHPQRVVIAFHGWRSAWYKDFGMVADFWYQHNCSVLYVEQRGQNSSGGEYMGFGLTERFDCLDWVNWVISRVGDALPIYLAGVSMGATTVLMAAGLKLPPNVHGIMADCGFTSPNAIWKHIARNNLHIAFGLRGAIADALCRQKILVGSDDYSTIDAMKVTHIPVMLVHGANDHFVPVEMTCENYAACAAPKQLLIVPGADHGMSYYVEPDKYETMALDFWHRYDAAIPQQDN